MQIIRTQSCHRNRALVRVILSEARFSYRNSSRGDSSKGSAVSSHVSHKVRWYVPPGLQMLVRARSHGTPPAQPWLPMFCRKVCRGFRSNAPGVFGSRIRTNVPSSVVSHHYGGRNDTRGVSTYCELKFLFVSEADIVSPKSPQA